jgi:hypothetical protein
LVTLCYPIDEDSIALRSITVTQSKKSFPPEKPEKSGLLKRLLCWIAKGADKSNMGKASGPT